MKMLAEAAMRVIIHSMWTMTLIAASVDNNIDGRLFREQHLITAKVTKNARLHLANALRNKQLLFLRAYLIF